MATPAPLRLGPLRGEVMRFTPAIRPPDRAGRVSVKMLPPQRLYMQMTEPKWVISMGACALDRGVFDTYAVVQGVTSSFRSTCNMPGCRAA